ncbi:MAG: CbiQ family ECF transporter T component [Gallionella sp.]|nr:CbiQ family ECF transporter T component [Gallionella sp.]
MKLHPATQILIWCVLVAAMQFLTPATLLVTGALVLSLAFALSSHKFVQLVRRTRWILFSLWLIYAYSTPGQAVWDAPFSPSLEGLLDGGLQLMRLLVALAGLAILLDRLHRQQLMAGLYSLFAPLEWLGLSRERLAVRLALTLHYAEVAMLRETRSWQDWLYSLFEPHGEVTKSMELPVYRFARLDVLLLAGALLLLWLAV